MRRVVLVADDFGLCPEVNRAVAETHAAGVVKAASLLVTGSALDDAVRTARETPGLSVGLHLALVEVPLALGPAEVPDLYGADGRPYPSHRALIAAWLLGRVSGESLRREVRAQAERFRATGLALEHVNGHQHLHVLPPVLDAVLDLGVPWVRVPGDRLWGRRPAGAAVLATLAARTRRRVRAAGLRCADAFRGFHHAGRLTTPVLERMLSALPEGATEIVCHPALAGPGLDPWRSWDYGWAEETAALTALGPALRQLGIASVRPDEA